MVFKNKSSLFLGIMISYSGQTFDELNLHPAVLLYNKDEIRISVHLDLDNLRLRLIISAYINDFFNSWVYSKVIY